MADVPKVPLCRTIAALIASLTKEDWDTTVVEVGAYDGVTRSISFPLLKSGWSGFLIEPNPEMYEKMREYLDGLKLMTARAGILNKPQGIYPYYLAKNDVCNTLNQDAKWLRPGKYTEGLRYVECIPLEILLTKWTSIPLDFTCLIIDTEGSDRDVIASMGAYNPKIIVTEVWSFDYASYQHKLQLLQNRGYVFLARIGHDDIFVHQDFFAPTAEQFMIKY